MRIGIDARFYGPLGKGLGRYTQEVVDKVIMINESSSQLDLSFVIFLSPDNFDEFKTNNPRVEKVKLSFRWYSLAEQLLFPFYIKKYKLDLIHFPHFNVPILCPTKFVVTIHDLILTHFPTMRATTKNLFIYRLKNLAYRLVLFSAVKRSSLILTVSDFTKQDILSLYKIKADKVLISYEGAADLKAENDIEFSLKNGDALMLDELKEADRFLLYVGSAYPHKNLENLIKLMRLLEQDNSDIKLVLVGKSDFFYERLKKEAHDLIESGRIIFAGYVPDAQLSKLYSRALAFIFPSLYEGFGLPPLEAMSHGCPVLSSDRSCLPEILGDSALYFNPEELEDIFGKIMRIAGDINLREKLISSGLERVKKYSWQECARITFNSYLQVLDKNGK